MAKCGSMTGHSKQKQEVSSSSYISVSGSVQLQLYAPAKTVACHPISRSETERYQARYAHISSSLAADSSRPYRAKNNMLYYRAGLCQRHLCDVWASFWACEYSHLRELDLLKAPSALVVRVETVQHNDTCLNQQLIAGEVPCMVE